MPLNPEPQALLRSQRNEVFRTVESAGFDPSQFRLADVATGTHGMVTRLEHTPSGYYFDIAVFGDKGVSLFLSPGELANEAMQHVPDWTYVEGWQKHWLGNLKREVGQPDLWESLLAGSIAGGDPSQNEPFSPDEIRQIGTGVANARAYAATLGLDTRSLDLVNSKLDEILAATQRLGRYDWSQWVVGAVIGLGTSLAANAAFNPAQARHLLDLIIHPVLRLFGS